MWLWLTVVSAVLLGLYDVAKKQALKTNNVFWILIFTSGLTVLILSPFITFGVIQDHYKLMIKALLVSASWISGLYAMKVLPITTVSSIKASRPMLVVIFSIILFGERLNIYQWIGVVTVIATLFLLGQTSKKESINSRKGLIYMLISVLTGSASALYDKHIIKNLDPLFVQIWSNVYIAIIVGILLIFFKSKGTQKFKWDWTLVIIAILITAADAAYFFALKQDGAMLSIISLIRRFAVVVTFIVGAIFFKEQKIRSKAVYLTILMIGLALLLIDN